MQESGRVDPQGSASNEAERRDQLRQEAIARREAISLRLADVREAILVGVVIASLGLTGFIDVAAPLSNVSREQGLSGSAPTAAADVGAPVSGAS